MSYSSTADELREHVRVQVALGYHDADWIADEAASMFEVDEEVVAPIVDECITALAAEAWPEVTDCDRLDAAFAGLDRAGVRARQHFACCNRCGHHEMTEDIHLARELGAKIEGYTFYHRQDAEAVVTSGLLRIRYATLGGEDEADAALGWRIVAALREQGFSPVWSGDPFETIVLQGFVWRRREWPTQEDEEAAWTADAALAEWTTLMRTTTQADLAAGLGSLYMEGLVELGHVDVARTWARAHSPSIVSPAPRCHALARLAERLNSPELALEALACVPFGRLCLLVEVLLRVDMKDPAVRRAARLRALEARPDIHGAAGVAWYLARSGDDDAGLIARVRHRLERTDEAPRYDDSSARAAIAAALWMIDARRGETASAGLMRGHVVAILAEWRYMLDGYAREAIRFAAEACGDAALAGEFAAKPLPASVAEAEANLAKIREGYDEGLFTHYEVGAAEHELLLVKLAHGDLEANIREYAAYARGVRDEVAGSGDDVRTDVERVRDGGRPVAFTTNDSLLAPTAERRLQLAIDAWTAASDRAARRQVGSRGRRILEFAAAFAGQGEVARANALIEMVLAADEDPVVDERAAIVALLAVDALDRAVAFAETSLPRCEAIAPLAVALAAAGRTEEALVWIRKAWPYAWSRERVVALAPALVAVAEDPRAAAGEVLACWAQANAGLDALLPAAWVV